MKRKHKENIFLLFSLLMFIASLLFYAPSEKNRDPVKATAFLPDYVENFEYTMLKQGMEQAAIDYDVELTFRTIREEETITEFFRTVQKEIESQTEVVIIQPKNKKVLGEKLKKIKNNVSIYFVNSAIDMEEPFPLVATDYVKLGERLASRIVERQFKKEKILILKENFDYTDTFDYYQGITSQLESASIPYDVKEVRGEKREEQIKQLLDKKGYTSVITFTSAMLENTAKVKNEENKSNIRLFGFQKSRAGLALIDDGSVEAIGISNQFAVGYQSIQQNFTEYDESQNISEIQQIIVDQKNLFSEENQKLLFPIVQ